MYFILIFEILSNFFFKIKINTFNIDNIKLKKSFKFDSIIINIYFSGNFKLWS